MDTKDKEGGFISTLFIMIFTVLAAAAGMYFNAHSARVLPNNSHLLNSSGALYQMDNSNSNYTYLSTTPQTDVKAVNNLNPVTPTSTAKIPL